MKIQKINKEKFKNWTIFLFFLVVSVLNSCSNFLSFDENRTDENKTAAQDDKCIITVSSDFYSNDGSRGRFRIFCCRQILCILRKFRIHRVLPKNGWVKILFLIQPLC